MQDRNDPLINRSRCGFCRAEKYCELYRNGDYIVQLPTACRTPHVCEPTLINVTTVIRNHMDKGEMADG